MRLLGFIFFFFYGCFLAVMGVFGYLTESLIYFRGALVYPIQLIIGGCLGILFSFIPLWAFVQMDLPKIGNDLVNTKQSSTRSQE
jgi:hypothetical protein